MVRTVRFNGWLGPVMLLQAGCGGSVDELDLLRPRGRPIYYGTEDTSPEHAAVVAITNGPHTGYFCSGTLITDTVVLTAGHCLEGGNRWDTEVFFGQDAYSNDGEYRGIADWLIHDDYDRWQLTGDIAIIRLSTAASATVTPILHLPQARQLTSDDVGATIDFAGFGVTETGSDGLKLHTEGTIGLVCPGPDSCDRGEVVPKSFRYDMDPAGPCSGDSGGPAFLFRDTREYVAGITSYGDWHCSDFGVNTTVSAYADWVEAFIEAGGVEDCTNGLDDDEDETVDCADWNCREHLDCVGPNTCDSPEVITCWDDITGTTVDAPSVFTRSGCTSSSTWNGPEVAYELNIGAGVEVTVGLHPLDSGELDLMLLPGTSGRCDPAGCLVASMETGTDAESISFTMPVRRRYVMVETWGAAGAYELTVTCVGVESCTNQVDDDNDGDVDCDDSDCAAVPGCEKPPEVCDNGSDDDDDGDADCDDDDCAEHQACQEDPDADEPPGCSCANASGGSVSIILALAALLVRRRRLEPPRAATPVRDRVAPPTPGPAR